MASLAQTNVVENTSVVSDATDSSVVLTSNETLRLQNKKRKTSEEDQQIVHSRIVEENMQLRREDTKHNK